MNLFWRFESSRVFAGECASKYKHRAERILSNYVAEHSIRIKNNTVVLDTDYRLSPANSKSNFTSVWSMSGREGSTRER